MQVISIFICVKRILLSTKFKSSSSNPVRISSHGCAKKNCPVFIPFHIVISKDYIPLFSGGEASAQHSHHSSVRVWGR